jgi:hypothetical protein
MGGGISELWVRMRARAPGYIPSPLCGSFRHAASAVSPPFFVFAKGDGQTPWFFEVSKSLKTGTGMLRDDWARLENVL